MTKSIFFSLILCLIYEAYGNHHIVRHMRYPSHRISSNIGPHDSSSSSPLIEAEANGGVGDAAATSLSPSSSLRKSFSLNNSLGYDKNRELGLNNKSLSVKYYRQQPNYINSDDLNKEQLQNSMSTRFVNNQPLSGRYYRNNENDKQNSMNSVVLNSKPQISLYNLNNQNDKTLKDKQIGTRENSITSDFQDYPNLTKTTINSSPSRIVRQSTLVPSSNEDHSQRISDGNDNLSMIKLMNSIRNSSNGQQIMFKSSKKCCINQNCRMLKDGEECSIDDYFKNMKTNQQPNNSMFTTSSNGDSRLKDIISKLMIKNGKSGQSSFNSLGGNMANFQETETPINMKLGSMRYSTIITSIGSGDGMGSYVMPEKIEPINYPHSDPIDVSEDEVNEIRNQVLQKSNLYRKKYNLDPFTLDDQLNNCAQDWANQMVKLQIFDHRDDNKVYGENLYSGSDLNNLGEQAVESWYNEITKFKIADEETELGTNIATHHMTQLLWKESKKLGVGVSRNRNGMYYVVANYDPIGNVRGYFKVNLPEITQEDIKEVVESQNSQTGSKQVRRSWFSSSASPLQSGAWNYDTYYN